MDLVDEKMNRGEKILDLNYLKKFIEEYKFLGHVQTSAKTNFNLAQVFEKLVNEILRRGLIIESSTNFPEDRSKSISLTKKESEKDRERDKKNCCLTN